MDFTSSGKIVNLEFQNISKFLKIINVNSIVLNELTEVNLIVQNQRDAVSLFAILKTPYIQQSIPLATIPVSKTLTPSI